MKGHLCRSDAIILMFISSSYDIPNFSYHDVSKKEMEEKYKLVDIDKPLFHSRFSALSVMEIVQLYMGKFPRKGT